MNSAYLINDASDKIDVTISIIKPEKIEGSFIFRKLSDDSDAIIYRLANKTTRIEFSVCSKCEFEMFFASKLLSDRHIIVGTLKIKIKNKTTQFKRKNIKYLY